MKFGTPGRPRSRTPTPRAAAPLLLLLVMASSPPPGADARPDFMPPGVNGPLGLIFEVTPTVAPRTAGGFGEKIALLPGGRGYRQSAGPDGPGGANEMAAAPAPRAAFDAAGGRAGGWGAPAPVLTLRLKNGGAMQPMDVGAPIMEVTAAFKPLAFQKGVDKPPNTDAFDLKFGVMWTPGPGAPPNNAGVFSLVHPLPAREFLAFGVPHRFRLTGLRRAAEGGQGLKPHKQWWNKDDADPAAGVGAMVVPMDGKDYLVEVLGELTVA